MSYPPRVADDYVGCPDVRDKDAFAARVHGDSMSPKYREGDIVIFSPAAAPRSGDDCFVRFEDGQTTFKRVFFESSETGQPCCASTRNEKYRPQVIAAEKSAGYTKQSTSTCAWMKINGVWCASAFWGGGSSDHPGMASVRFFAQRRLG